jgi:NADH-quinone oxidoreductase subunit N
MYFGKEGATVDSRMAPVQWTMLAGSAVLMLIGVVSLFGIEPAAALAAQALVR